MEAPTPLKQSYADAARRAIPPSAEVFHIGNDQRPPQAGGTPGANGGPSPVQLAQSRLGKAKQGVAQFKATMSGTEDEPDSTEQQILFALEGRVAEREAEVQQALDEQRAERPLQQQLDANTRNSKQAHIKKDKAQQQLEQLAKQIDKLHEEVKDNQERVSLHTQKAAKWAEERLEILQQMLEQGMEVEGADESEVEVDLEATPSGARPTMLVPTPKAFARAPALRTTPYAR